LKVINLTEPKPGVFIFDFGQNFAGWAKVQLSAPAGTKVVLRYGELLNADGTLNPMSSVAGQIKGARKAANGQQENVGGPGAPLVAWQSDTYVAKGDRRESYTPRFTFHAFRYVEITGLPDRPSLKDVTGLRLNTDVEPAGSFQCSNEQFNRIQEMCDWTFLSNLFSVQSDCPHRERFGYGGDIAATSEAFMMNYDMATFYAKAVRDWQDSALPDGMLTDTAPSVGIHYCGIGWAMAHPLLLRQLYQYYGDRQLVEDQFETARRWLDLVARANPDNLIARGLSDHESLEATPAPAMVTPLYAACARTLGELAAILGRKEEAQRYELLHEQIRQAYLEKFFAAASGKVGSGTQASQAFALYWNLLPEDRRSDALQFLCDDIRFKHKDHLTTGIFGTKYMLAELSRAGEADLASMVVSQRTFPGWGYMLENGATTLWEHWKGSDNTYSQNHPMFGSVSEWFYQWLGGIQPATDAVGFDRIIIRPQPVKDLEWVRCGYRSVRGEIASNWKRVGNRLKLEVVIPANTTATVYLPAGNVQPVKEGGRPVENSPGVLEVRTDNGKPVVELGSGHYDFEISK
jgi:alpha-L-rhamnosidase